MIIPSTSPIAQPVRQCSGRREREAVQRAVRVSRTLVAGHSAHYTRQGYLPHRGI